MNTPPAPGRLGEAIDARLLYSYLAELTEWVTESRRELDALDAEVLDRKADLTADVILGLSLWQEANNRTQAITVAWDSGRADNMARQHISSLIWGAETGKNLPEIGRLLDLVIAKIRQQLGLDSGTSDHLVRLNRIQAQFERIGQTIIRLDPAEPVWITLANLTTRLDGLKSTRNRGGDISGPLVSLENDVAKLERDAIMATSAASQSQTVPPDPRIAVYQQISEIRESLLNIPGTPQPIINSVSDLLATMKGWING